MTKLKLPIIIALVLVAGVAGLFVSGVIGGDKSTGKPVPVTPVTMALGSDPNGFTINTADSTKAGFVVFNLALQPKDMSPEALLLWEGEGGEGGATDPPGPAALATYPKYRDAVIAVAATFTSSELLARDGQAKLKQALLDKFEEIAQRDEAAYGVHKKGEVQDPTHPPYHIKDVFLQNFAVQVNE